MFRKHRRLDTATIESELTSEYRYASRHHLIPLYTLTGIAILGFLVLTCFVIVFWQNTVKDSFRPAVERTIEGVENMYLPTAIVPSEKKQYIYSANIRFPIQDPYETFRYAYDPGTARALASPTITLTTTQTLQALEATLRSHPAQVNDYDSRFQNCARLYVIRFTPGDIAYGGFAPFKAIKLKDGRTAYMQKNISCVPNSVQAMNQLDDIEKDLSAIESF